MSYYGVEVSVNQGEPVELYQFQRGVDKYNYCSGAFAVVYGGDTYLPIPIRRDRVKQGTDPSKNDIKIMLPRDNEFGQQFLGFAPDEITTLNIFRGHHSDNNFIIYWKGRIVGAEVSGNEVTISCESVFTSIRRTGLRAVFEYNCRHALYGIACRAAPSSYEVSGVISDIRDNGLTVQTTAAGSFASGYFVGGMVGRLTGLRRFVVNHVGSDLTLARPVPEFSIGMAIKMYPGCDHTKATCNAKFGNIDNFGGFPYIPVRNPFDGGSIV